MHGGVRPLVPGPLARRAITAWWRHRGVLVAGVLAAALWCTARAAPVLIDDATSDRAFAAEVADVDDGVPYARRADLRGYVSGLADDRVARRLTDLVDDLPVWAPPTVAFVPERYQGAAPRPVPVVRRADGTGGEVAAVLYARTDGPALLTPVGADGPPGAAPTDGAAAAVWLPDTVAEALAVVIGDEVELELVGVRGADGADVAAADPPPIATASVAGVYETDTAGLPRSDRFDWSAIVTDLPNSPNQGEAVAPLIVAGTDDVVALASAMGDTLRVTWDAAWQGPDTIDRGRTATRSFESIAARLRDPFDVLGAVTADAGMRPMRLVSGIPDFVDRSDETAAALRPLVESMALAVQLLCAGLVGAAAWLLAAGRTNELTLVITHGVPTARTAVWATVEQVPAVVLGTALAWWAVDPLGDLAAGTGAPSPDAIAEARRACLVAAPLLLALHGLVWAAATSSLQPVRTGLLRLFGQAVRWEVVVAVLAVATGVRLATEDDTSASTSTLLFPILALLAASAVVASVARLVLTRLRHHVGRAAAGSAPRHVGWWMCRQRVRAGLVEGSTLLVLVATGVGLVGYTGSASSSAADGVAAKAAVLAGARHTAVVPWSGALTGRPGPPVGLPDGWSVVWSDRGVDVGPDRRIDLLVVDPATLPGAAEWRDDFAGDDLRTLLGAMAAVPDDRIGIVVSGWAAGAVPSSGSMSNGFWTVAFEVVARVEALPGLAERSTMAMIDADRFFALIPEVEDPRVPQPGRTTDNPDGNFRTQVWSSGSAAEFVEVLDDAGLVEVVVGGSAVERQRPDLVAFGWSLPVLRVVGAAALVLAVLALAMHSSRRRARSALDVAVLRELGWSRHVVRTAVGGEMVVSTALGAAVGGALSWVLTRVMVPRLDPDPALRPRFTAAWSFGWTSGATAVVVVAAAIVAWREVRSCERMARAEVFRGDT